MKDWLLTFLAFSGISGITPAKPSGLTGLFYLIVTRATLSVSSSATEDTRPHILCIFHSIWSSSLKEDRPLLDGKRVSICQRTEVQL